MKLKVTAIIIAILLFVLYNSFFVVDERKQVIITQFGKPVGDAIKEPGLGFIIPFIQEVNEFDKNLLEWDGDPGQIPTLDKRYIDVDTFARWKIVDPLRFFRTVHNEMGAQGRLDDILDAAVRNLIAKYSLIETVRMTNRELDTSEVVGEVKIGRIKITKEIMEQAQPKLEKFGIELVDVEIKRLNYVSQVQRSIFDRMIAERKQIAEKFRSEGHGEARKIEGDMEKEMKRITSEAYKSAEEIKGKADAEAIAIYAKALEKDPEFYSFQKTLDIYKQSIGKDSSLILSTESEFLKYFNGYKGKQ